MTNSNMDVIYAEMVTKVQQVRISYIYCKHYVSTCFSLNHLKAVPLVP